jgi:hypothetical protein
LEKFTKKEIKERLGQEEKEVRKKVFLLANGLIGVHGFEKEEAFEKALRITRKLRDNGGKYSK